MFFFVFSVVRVWVDLYGVGVFVFVVLILICELEFCFEEKDKR